MAGSIEYRKLDREKRHTYRLRAWNGSQQVSKTFKFKGGKRDADNAAQVALAAFVGGTGTVRVASTVSELWGLWLRDDLEGRLSPTTLRDYKSAMNYAILPTLGSIKLAALTSHQLDAFYREKEIDGASARTVLKYHRILSSMFRQAERWGWITHSPVRNARAPRATRTEITPPPLDVVKALVDACDTDLMRLLVLLAASLGARRGELMALRWEDIDVAKRTVEISKSAYEVVGGGVAIKSTKTDKPRVVSIDPQAASALERLRGDGFIFSDDGLTPWRPDHATKAFGEVRTKVPAAKGIRLHDLRHWHATYLLDAGFNPVVVSKRLGHANVSTTLNIYSHAIDERDRAASNAIGKMLSGDKHGGSVDGLVIDSSVDS